MVAISITSEVEEAYTYENERTVFNAINSEFEKGSDVELSFDGFTIIPSSFANSCFVVLLEKYGFDRIKRNLKVTHSTKQINQMIKSRLGFKNVRINRMQFNISQPQVGSGPNRFLFLHLRQVRSPTHGSSNITRN